MKYYCNHCNNFFEADPAITCPHCGAVGDELEECESIESLYDGLEATGLSTYSIYLGGTVIASTEGTEFAYAVWRKTKELADLLTTSACLVWDATGEVIEDNEPEELEYTEPNEDDEPEWEEPDWDAYEQGFDPYMGCYTGDC